MPGFHKRRSRDEIYICTRGVIAPSATVQELPGVKLVRWPTTRTHSQPTGGRCLKQPTRRCQNTSTIHSLLFVCQTAIKSHYGSFFSAPLLLILNFLFKVQPFLLIASFLVDWGPTPSPWVHFAALDRHWRSVCLSVVLLYVIRWYREVISLRCPVKQLLSVSQVAADGVWRPRWCQHIDTFGNPPRFYQLGQYGNWAWSVHAMRHCFFDTLMIQSDINQISWCPESPCSNTHKCQKVLISGTYSHKQTLAVKTAAAFWPFDWHRLELSCPVRTETSGMDVCIMCCSHGLYEAVSLSSRVCLWSN